MPLGLLSILLPFVFNDIHEDYVNIDYVYFRGRKIRAPNIIPLTPTIICILEDHVMIPKNVY